jgi:hypothetical protein
VGDGLPDLAVANQNSNNVSILLMNPAGTELFTPTNFPTGAWPQAIVAGDYNKDGHTDLATANASFGKSDVALLLGNGAGAFSAPPLRDRRVFSLSLAVSDFNNDGNPDLAVADGAGNALILRDNGKGTFQAPTALKGTQPILHHSPSRRYQQ